MSRNTLFHITTADQTEAASGRGEYLPEGFEEEGFIHCSYREQVVRVANDFYAGRSDLVLLEIDRERVGSDVVDENLDGGTELFPHIYGPLPLPAVRRTHPFSCREDGTFELP